MPRRTPFLIAALTALTLLPGCAGMPSGGTAAAPERAAVPEPSSPYGMMQIAPQVFVEAGMPASSTAKLLNLVDKARVRTAYFYGELQARPQILLCASMDCYRRFGGVGLGYTLGNTVIISPQGLRAAIISHELSHVELAARLGGRQDILELIPQWFDEGTAVMASLAYEFSDEAWLEASLDGTSAPLLHELESRDGWNAATGINGCSMQRSYGTARHEVARWYGKVGRDGFQRLIQALNSQIDFHLAYQHIETTSTPLLTASK